jgi:hypothetical protein
MWQHSEKGRVNGITTQWILMFLTETL